MGDYRLPLTGAYEMRDVLPLDGIVRYLKSTAEGIEGVFHTHPLMTKRQSEVQIDVSLVRVEWTEIEMQMRDPQVPTALDQVG